jgi:carboxypeptidase T
VRIDVPNPTGDLSFRYFFAHASNSSEMDFFRAYIETSDGHRTVVTEERGSAKNDPPAWLGTRVSLAPWAGQSIRIVFEAADRGPASTVEAAVDDVKVWRP